MLSRGSEQRSSTITFEELRVRLAMSAMAWCAPHTPIPPRRRQIAGHCVEVGHRLRSDAQIGSGARHHAGDLAPPEPPVATGDRSRLVRGIRCR